MGAVKLSKLKNGRSQTVGYVTHAVFYEFKEPPCPASRREITGLVVGAGRGDTHCIVGKETGCEKRWKREI